MKSNYRFFVFLIPEEEVDYYDLQIRNVNIPITTKWRPKIQIERDIRDPFSYQREITTIDIFISEQSLRMFGREIRSFLQPNEYIHHGGEYKWPSNKKSFKLAHKDRSKNLNFSFEGVLLRQQIQNANFLGVTLHFSYDYVERFVEQNERSERFLLR